MTTKIVNIFESLTINYVKAQLINAQLTEGHVTLGVTGLLRRQISADTETIIYQNIYQN